jgi:glycosyltransferase involved in cell wall biosynthesis
MPDRPQVVALVTDAIAPFHRGGKEQYYGELVKRLSAHVEVHVYTMNWWRGAKVWRDGDVTYHAIAPFRPLYSGERRSIREAAFFALHCFKLLVARFDVIDADHMPYMQLFPLRIVATLRRKRLVVTWHECWGPEYWRSYLGPIGRIGWWIESLAMRLPDSIICTSPQTAEQVLELVSRNVPVITATPGIDLEAFSGIEAALDPADVVAVGRLLPHKRIDLLLDALAILRDAGRPVTASVIGSGPQLVTLEDQARSLGLSELVTFRQDVSDQPTLYGLLKGARALVFPSEREGFGIAVLEALACGVPVITTSAPANYAQRLVEVDPNGVVCDPTPRALADAIAAMLDCPAGSAPADSAWLREYDWATITQNVATALA